MEKKTNYRAHIRLVPQNRDADNWTHLIKLLANWINHRNPNESTKSKIYGGIRNGELQYRNDGIEVTVISEHKQFMQMQVDAQRMMNPTEEEQKQSGKTFQPQEPAENPFQPAKTEVKDYSRNPNKSDVSLA